MHFRGGFLPASSVRGARAVRTASILMTVAFAASGCNQSPDPWHRVPVEGDVKLTKSARSGDVNGLVTFVPAAGIKGPAAATKIVAGRYKFDPATGPVAGEHDVILNVEADAADGAATDNGSRAAEGKRADRTTSKAAVPTSAGPKKKQIAEHRLSVRVAAEKPYRIDLIVP